MAAELPKRIPFEGGGPPAADYGPPALELVERYIDAIREWAGQPDESSQCRGAHAPRTRGV